MKVLELSRLYQYRMTQFTGFGIFLLFLLLLFCNTYTSVNNIRGIFNAHKLTNKYKLSFSSLHDSFSLKF